jgi:hypothetical protein
MDRLTAFVAIAHLKLRLEILQKHPEYLEMATGPTTPTLPAPMEFAGLKSRLQRAKGLEKRAAVAGPRLDAALDVIETGVGVLETHAPELEKYGQDLMSTIQGMLEPSNGAPPGPLPGAETVTVTAAEVGSVASVLPMEPTPPPGPNGGPRILNPA